MGYEQEAEYHDTRDVDCEEDMLAKERHMDTSSTSISMRGMRQALVRP
jgi:hypothetical protein